MESNIIGLEIKDGISLFCACRNREENLQISLSSWLSFDEVNEIVIVDWSSDISPSITDDRVSMIRAENEDGWCLSKAYNLAAGFTTRTNICKVDCDYILKNDFFNKYEPDQKSFYAGNHNICRDRNEKFLNGLVYLKRDIFFSVNGYNENIIKYGYDDTDLYKRLETNCIERLDISPDDAEHIEHPNDVRGISENFWDSWPENADSLIENMNLSSARIWSTDDRRASYHISKQDNFYKCKRIRKT